MRIGAAFPVPTWKIHSNIMRLLPLRIMQHWTYLLENALYLFIYFFLNLVPTGGSSFIIDEISANEIKKRHLYDTIILPETEKFNTVNASKYIAESSAWFGRHSCFSHKIWSNSWSILVSYLSRYYSKSHDKLHNFTCDIRLHTSSLWIFDRFSWQ